MGTEATTVHASESAHDSTTLVRLRGSLHALAPHAWSRRRAARAAPRAKPRGLRTRLGRVGEFGDGRRVRVRDGGRGHTRCPLPGSWSRVRNDEQRFKSTQTPHQCVALRRSPHSSPLTLYSPEPLTNQRPPKSPQPPPDPTAYPSFPPLHPDLVTLMRHSYTKRHTTVFPAHVATPSLDSKNMPRYH